MRARLIKILADLAVNKTKLMLWIMAGVTLITMVLSGGMSMTPKWSDMLPEGDKRTLEFDRILEEFQSASSIIVVAQGSEADIKAFADDLAPRVLDSLTIPGKDKEPAIYVRRVDYKADLDFMKDHGFMLMKEDDLKNLKDIFQDPGLAGLLTNMNNSFEKEYIQPSESMSTREEEDGALIFLNGINDWVEAIGHTLRTGNIRTADAEAAVDKLLVGEPYFLSYDREALIMNLIPTFSMMDAFMIVDGTDAVQAVLNEVLENHPDVQAGLSGAIAVGRDEMYYSSQGLEISMGLSFFLIGALLYMAFRMAMAPALALLNLIIGLIWAAGIVAVVVPVLNIMTAMFMIILIGLGIDFSIHIISTFTEMRAKGLSLEAATLAGLQKSGGGVSTGALTTSVAFLALMIGDSRAMSELGLVTAIGLLAVMISSFVLLPVFLVVRERRYTKKRIKKGLSPELAPRDLTLKPLGKAGIIIQDNPWLSLTAVVVVTILLAFSAKEITFNHNMMDLEAEGLPSIMLQDTVQEKFDLSMDFAYLVSESVEESRDLRKKAKELPSVASVEDISIFIPSPEQQAKRAPHIEEIHALMEIAQVTPIRPEDLDRIRTEIERLEMNIMEFQSMAFLGGQDKVYRRCTEIVGSEESPPDITVFSNIYGLFDQGSSIVTAKLNAFQDAYADYFTSSVLQMANTSPLSLDVLPESIVDRYASKDRSLFLTTVLPSGNIWQDKIFMEQFGNELETVSERTTGMPVIMRALFEIIGRDGRNAAYLTLVLVYLILLLDFRSFKYALIAMMPLATGAVWMVGLMQLFGFQLDMMNVMALPLILGIGIDDGVHVVHRWRLEGPRSANIVLSSTGKAVLLTSLTTILAFGSMMFSPFRGYASLSYALIFGVGACFFTTIIILPAFMGLLDKRK
ncbi:MAG: MMPL family transporter [FCB group bacterium]|nr:MMPL family transporter [FCB group bacterium]MBL7029368.1 MMPL family transporter [Candidatus Neomarinimicrobiota bacterium]MBL7123051.1 MMPL family transporter [Candidatus Neomarinimicrobiota bacterium]